MKEVIIMAINFNSHAHVERDLAFNITLCILPISTHTLTWSVTNLSCCFLRAFAISTHTLTWSVTCYLNHLNTPLRISTHTLTWSVTQDLAPMRQSTRYFNSHAHVERDYHCQRKRRNNDISTHTLTWSVTCG